MSWSDTTHQSAEVIRLILTVAFLDVLVFILCSFVSLIEVLIVSCFGAPVHLMNIERRMRDVLFSILSFVLIDWAFHFGGKVNSMFL